jgi:hypothetical protein
MPRQQGYFKPTLATTWIILRGNLAITLLEPRKGPFSEDDQQAIKDAFNCTLVTAHHFAAATISKLQSLVYADPAQAEIRICFAPYVNNARGAIFETITECTVNALQANGIQVVTSYKKPKPKPAAASK